jgi:RNA polymerase sigma-70 factor (ECF subfamily)
MSPGERRPTRAAVKSRGGSAARSRPGPKPKAGRARPAAAQAKPRATAARPPVPKPAVAARPVPSPVVPAPVMVRTRLEDAELVRLSQGGDNRAFDELVRRYRDKVYRLSFKILRHEEDASEALQDAFLSAYRGLRNFKSESTFSTWLYRIATNASLMKYRKRRDNHVSLEQSQSHNDDAEPLEVPDWSSQPEDDLLDSETRQVMEESVERLPEDLRIVFQRRDVLEESNADVAEALDLSVAAVKSRLHRARKLLRDRLNRYFADKMTKKDRER